MTICSVEAEVFQADGGQGKADSRFPKFCESA